MGGSKAPQFFSIQTRSRVFLLSRPVWCVVMSTAAAEPERWWPTNTYGSPKSSLDRERSGSSPLQRYNRTYLQQHNSKVAISGLAAPDKSHQTELFHPMLYRRLAWPSHSFGGSTLCLLLSPCSGRYRSGVFRQLELLRRHRFRMDRYSYLLSKYRYQTDPLFPRAVSTAWYLRRRYLQQSPGPHQVG